MELPSLEEYEEFLEEKVLGFGLRKLEKYYDGVVYPMKKTFEESDFLKRLKKNLPTYNEEYLMKKEYPLMSRIEPIEIEIKPFNSMICKCYRKDVINNTKWLIKDFDLEARYDWISPLRCFEEFTDILRTRISVRYLDGAVFLAEKMKSLADSLELAHKLAYKAEEEGYYAIHFDLTYPFEIPSITFDTYEIQSNIEFQINTEIQDLIVDLAFKYYEQRRIRPKRMDEKWQWNYECDEFLPNYLGHIIHYIEGMIMEVRERK